MAGKISQMTAATTPYAGTELVEIVQGGASVKGTTQDIANAYKGTRGTAIASAATVDLGAATGNNLHITGTTTITSLGTVAAGTERTVIFDGALTLTHNATSLFLPNNGSNITTAAGDSATFISEGSGNWRCTRYQRVSGQSVAGGSVTSVNGLTGAVTLGGESIAEPVNSLSSSSGTVTVNCASGDYFTFSLTENVTAWSFTNLPASGKAQTIMIRIQQNASSAKTVAWPSSFKWAGGSAGAVSTSLSAYDNLAITTFDQGTRWEATLSKAHS